MRYPLGLVEGEGAQQLSQTIALPKIRSETVEIAQKVEINYCVPVSEQRDLLVWSPTRTVSGTTYILSSILLFVKFPHLPLGILVPVVHQLAKISAGALILKT
jgi:hypothetical protein